MLLKQEIANPRSFALLKAGSNMAARMAMMAMTTSSSIKVKADFKDFAREAMPERTQHGLAWHSTPFRLFHTAGHFMIHNLSLRKAIFNMRGL